MFPSVLPLHRIVGTEYGIHFDYRLLGGIIMKASFSVGIALVGVIVSATRVIAAEPIKDIRVHLNYGNGQIAQKNGRIGSDLEPF